jgi:hypothetical protein
MRISENEYRELHQVYSVVHDAWIRSTCTSGLYQQVLKILEEPQRTYEPDSRIDLLLSVRSSIIGLMVDEETLEDEMRELASSIDHQITAIQEGIK